MANSGLSISSLSLAFTSSRTLASFSVMPQEAKVLSDKAKANGMNEAEYIRLLISQKPNDYPEVRKLLKELINEINRIGININQIVFNSNAQLYSRKDKEQLVAYMKKLNQSVGEAVVKIGNQ